MTKPSQHIIIISPIEEIDPELTKRIGNEVDRLFGFPTQTKTILRDVEFALNPDRDQHHSTAILEKLSGLAPDGAARVLAITRVDLFIPILTHVYGEAQLGGKACIVSTHRLNENLSMGDRDAFYHRIVKEAVHELGHTFNLRHCQDSSCLMHYCRSIRDVDRKSEQFCRYCRILLSDELKRMSSPKHG